MSGNLQPVAWIHPSVQKAAFLGNGYIGIQGPNGLVYDIDLERCQTPMDILHWVTHLSLKRWFTREMLRDFLELAYPAAGLRYY